MCNVYRILFCIWMNGLHEPIKPRKQLRGHELQISLWIFKYIYVDLTCTIPRDGPFGTSAPPTVIKIDCHAVHTLLIQEIGFEDQI